MARSMTWQSPSLSQEKLVASRGFVQQSAKSSLSGFLFPSPQTHLFPTSMWPNDHQWVQGSGEASYLPGVWGCDSMSTAASRSGELQKMPSRRAVTEHPQS